MSTHTLISRPSAPIVPVSVNDVVITPDAISAETQHHPSRKPEAAWKAAAEALVIREALLQRARGLNITAVPVKDEAGRIESDDDALIRTLLEAEVTTPDPDEDSCRRYFEKNRRKPELFSRMARDRSDCASATEGGRLGQITTGQTTPMFEAALAKMKPGQIYPEPVETPYGLHIIRLDESRPGDVPDFDMARPLVEEFLRDASWRRAVAQFVSLVLGEAKITGVELKGANSPLVQ